MDGQYWKDDQTMSTNEWLLTSDFWQFLEPWHGRWYEYEIFIASCTDNIYDLENERWLLGDMIDHVGIYGSKVAEGLSAFNAGLVGQVVPILKLPIYCLPFLRNCFIFGYIYCEVGRYISMITKPLNITYTEIVDSAEDFILYKQHVNNWRTIPLTTCITTSHMSTYSAVYNQ